MAVSTSISRLAAYYTRHGLEATVHRAALALRRAFSNVMVLLYCDLSEETALSADSDGSTQVEQKRSCAELSQEDLQAMTSFWNPKLAYRNIHERFGEGAVLWLIKSGGRLAGYGWSLQGRTIEPHYFPLGQRDAHLFDFHVFPQYRGRGMNPFLVRHILRRLAAEGGARAFIEAAGWNQAQLWSLGKTPFHRFGRARKWTILGHTIVCWAGNETVHQERTGNRESLPGPAPAKNVRSSALHCDTF